MRSRSVTVEMTPRQAVSAARGCELAGLTTGDRRAFAARHRIFAGLRDAGWEWDEDSETWRRARSAISDRP